MSLKAYEIQEQFKCKISISTLLEYEAKEFDRQNGFDIADFMIEEIKAPLSFNSQKNEFLSPHGENPQRWIEARRVWSEVIPDIQIHSLMS